MPFYQVKDKKKIAPLYENWKQTVIWSCLQDCMGITYLRVYSIRFISIDLIERQSKKVTKIKNTQFSIRCYETTDKNTLFELLEREGEEWKDYWQGDGQEKYKKALENSVVYLIFENDELCGYARCHDDDGYGLYVYDLLIDKKHRGKEYGRLLMEQACKDFPDSPTYVLSDVDPYYEKLGYKKEGTVFLVSSK